MAITFSEVSSSAAASQVFVEQEAVNRVSGSPVIPHKILVLGQYNSGKSPTDNTPQLILNKEDAWDRYGRGSLLAAQIEKVIAAGGISPIYALPLADDGSATAATGTIAFTGTATSAGTVALYINGKKITAAVSDGDTADAVATAVAAAVNADLDLPVTASATTGTVTLTARWSGESGNQISAELNRGDSDSLPAGITATVTDVGDDTAGATNPVLDTALGNLGDTWYTEIVCPYLDSTSLAAIKNAGDTRADAGVKRPFLAFAGNTDTSSAFITELDNHNNQWLSLIHVSGSPSAAYEIAATTGGVWAKVQNATPGRPAKTQTLPGIFAGDTNDLTYSTLNTIFTAGGSTTRNTAGGGVTLLDVATTRTETDAGAETDDWRYASIVPNLQFKIYALENTFLASPFDQAVVLADGSGPGPTYGVRPSTVKAYAVGLIDDWVERGLSTNRDSIIENTSAEINSSNPGRIDLVIGDIATAPLNIVAVKLEWSFVN